MERYDAILEQLRKAQSRGIETITNRLDFVVQSLEELINEAKSSVQGALPESADELFPVDEIEAALDSYRQQAEAHTAAVRRARIQDRGSRADCRQLTPGGVHHSHAGPRRGSKPVGAAQGTPPRHLRERRAGRGSRSCARAGSRHGAGSVSPTARFCDHGKGMSQKVRRCPSCSKFPGRFASPRPEDDLFRSWFADEVEPDEILLIPVVLRGKLMGTVYIDRLEGQPWDPDTAQTSGGPGLLAHRHPPVPPDRRLPPSPNRSRSVRFPTRSSRNSPMDEKPSPMSEATPRSEPWTRARRS